MSRPELTITARAEDAADAAGAATLTLPFGLRCRSRLRAVLDDGREVALFLARGEILRGGDLLRGEDGSLVRVCAAAETVSTGATDDALRLARACYHLGNRHVPLQVGPGWLRYGHDHVLDDMVRALGLDVRSEDAPFEPEPGAYESHGHLHETTHEPAQGNGHAHDSAPAPESGHGHTHTHGDHGHPHRH